MKKLLLTFIAVFSFSALTAAQDNNYTIVLKNGLRVDCVSYKLAGTENVSVVYADGKTVTVRLDDIEKIEIIKSTSAQQSAITPIPLEEMRQTPQVVQQKTPVYVTQPVYYSAPPKNPFLAGFLSFVIPGVGQFYNGQVGAGVGFLLGAVGGLALANVFAYDGAYEAAVVCYLATVVVDIWAIVHAVNGAQRINAQRGLALGNGMYLNVQPAVLNSGTFASNNNYHYGLGVSLSF